MMDIGFGYELEDNGLSVSRVKQFLRDNNLTYCWVETDATDVVDAEVVFPPCRIVILHGIK